MMRRSKPLGVLLAAALTLTALPATAEPPAAGLAQVKKAYADVDYEKVRELAAAAIRRGDNDRPSTAELYWLWGTAAAALDRSEEAVSAFVHALAPNPELKLDRNLSPKLRAPYLEARGKLGAFGNRAPLDVTLQRRHEQLEISLHDALEVVGSLELGTREPGSSSFARRKLPAAPVHQLPKPRGTELAFFVRVLDRYGNVLLELGTPDEPRRLAQVRSNASSPPSSPTAPSSGPDRSPTPYYVVAGTLATLGLASFGAATVMHVRRENAAREWNGEACERPGSTRAQQCADVDDRRERAEHLTIGFSAAGGALLVGSVVSLLLAPHAHPKASVAVSAAPRQLMVGWKAEL